jgi:peptidoglycan/xylan/chitin deacetylase (PgdA/CDA1 family)
VLMQGKLLRTLKFIRKEYYQRRYWSNLIRTMEDYINKNINNNQNGLLPYVNKPGIAFSFDDSYRVNDWYKYGKDMFGYYDVKVTFNINAFHHFENQREHTQKEIDMLLELQANGHEIAHHGLKHRRATGYSSEVGLSKWAENEVISLFNWMDKQAHSITNERFKKSVSFAFPHFLYNDDNIMELVPQYYKIVRGHLDKDNLTSFNHIGFAPSICIDNYYSCNPSCVKKIMKLVKQTGKNLIITCHSILPEEVNWQDFGWGDESAKSGTWRTSPNTIQAIIDEARKMDLEFYTTSELAGVATFIDHNFEKCVRRIISNPSDQWISITELSFIKELDLSNQNISSLDGIQYFLNLETLNLSNNNITDLRLIEKLPMLKKININDNPISKCQEKQIKNCTAVLN